MSFWPKTVYSWIPDFDSIKKSNKNLLWPNLQKRDLSITHPLLSADGSIIFHSDTTLLKINRYSKLIWLKSEIYHRSIEYNADSNIWICSQIPHPKSSIHFLVNYNDDAITKISRDGVLLFKKSIGEILTSNGYMGLFLGVGRLEKDLGHLNDVRPACHHRSIGKLVIC
jgi:hypothetical protein